MQYMLLLYSAEDAGPEPGSPEFAAEMQQWFAVTEEMQSAGVMVAGEALQPGDTATTLRVRENVRLTTDGPFAETKEVLGGFYIVDVEHLDAALDWAAKIPSVPYGSVEVRPVMDMPDSPG